MPQQTLRKPQREEERNWEERDRDGSGEVHRRTYSKARDPRRIQNEPDNQGLRNEPDAHKPISKDGDVADPKGSNVDLGKWQHRDHRVQHT